jgi:ATP-dependent exoDNAse (exonuclease V) alpha subunit
MGKKVFNKELLYVALSRCKWFSGIVLVNMNLSKFLTSLKPNIQKIK